MRLSGTVFSQVLGMDTGLTIITPNEWQREGQYNVAYLLHGLCGDHKTWLDYSLLPVYANAGNTIYILPEAGRSFYTDMQYGLPYFTYLTEELPQICQRFFRLTAEREHTAILGCSMGGYGALKCALRKPEQYGSCGAFSASCLLLQDGLAELKAQGLRPELQDAFGRQVQADFIAIFGKELAWRPEEDVLALAQRVAQGPVLPRLYFTCGTKDPFYQDHLQFCQALTELQVPYTLETWEAGHDFAYFNEALARAIRHFAL